MEEAPQWRKSVALTGMVLVGLNPIYWILALNIEGRFNLSDRVFGDLILTGVLIGIISLSFSFFATGMRRALLIVLALLEMFLWSFMAVGM
ncbi:hypothetical protein [Granulicella paludicola]|uniref:hypothetical protein n=1 Tax=Granulicella paludicola TaxID=474951 RepID=UPI0021E07916|nr:hypothetical protein [Granulicella paludicola]